MSKIGKRTIPGASTTALPARPAGQTRQYTLRLVTPMFGGGAKAGKPDLQMPIRASSIRGHLRYWWRMLYRNQFARDGKLDVPATRTMRAREAEIWGSTEQPSAVQVRVEPSRLAEKDYRTGKLFGFPQLSPEAYALFSAIESKEVDEIVREEFEFTLHVSWPDINELNRLRTIDNQQLARHRQPQRKATIDDFTAEVEATVATWVALGGVGARTRRGLGAVEIVESSHPVPPFRLPSGARLFAAERNTSNAMHAWHQAVDVYQRFRQSFRGKRHEKTFPGGSIGQPPGRSHWPEPDSIRQITGCALDDDSVALTGTPDDENTHQHTTPIVTQEFPNFPRAVLGLPIGFHFATDGPGKGNPAQPKRDPATVELVPRATGPDGTLLDCEDGHGNKYKDERGNILPKAGDRMASPIITKPVFMDGNWYAAVIVLPHAHALAVNAVLKGEDARWDATGPKAVDLLEAIPNSQIVGSHLTALCPKGMNDPMRGHTNAVEAFVAFLRQKSDGANPAQGKPPFKERAVS